MPTLEEIKLDNELLLDSLLTPGQEKRGQDALTDYVRTTIREDGFFDRIIEPIDVKNSQLTPSVSDDNPSIVLEKEPDSPPAITVPFRTNFIRYYLTAPRYRVDFERVQSREYQKDIDQLRTYTMDLRTIITDQGAKEIHREQDRKFIAAVNAALGSSAGTTLASSNAVQWQQISGGISRRSVQEAFKVMPRTPFRLEVDCVLVNNITIRDILKWSHDEVGGPKSQDLLWNGLTTDEFMGVKWIVTNKQDLVPESTLFMFADPDYIGRNLVLADTVMWVEKKKTMLSFCMWKTVGAAIAHTGGLARTDHL